MSHINTSANDNDDDSNSTSWPPGTVRLEKSGPRSTHEIALRPRPSRDPNDPLNWSMRRKIWNFGLVCFYVAMVAQSINAATPTWGPMHRELGYSYELLNDSYAASCAALAVGSLILIPFALEYGRRPVYLFSALVQLGISIWSAKMQTAADLMLINVIQCFFGSLAEVIVQMTIADVFFVHQRGRMNAIYVWVWLLSSYLGILIAGFVTKGQGWRWVWWWNTIIFGCAILVFGFGYEETKFSETIYGTRLPEHSPEIAVAQQSESAQAARDTELKTYSTKHDHNDGDVADVSQIMDEDVTKQSDDDLYVLDPTIPRKTYRERLAVFTRTPSDTPSRSAFVRHMYQPLLLLTTIPAVAYAALVYGILVGLGDVMSTTLSTYLTKPPYNFTSDQIGLMSIPRMIGVSIGALIIGPLSDWSIVYLSRRRNGIYEPEMRLWCIIPFIIFVPVGALLFAFGLNNHLAWPIIAVGLALYNVGVAPINSIVITYLTDSYQEVIGSALVGVTVVRNCFSTAFIFALSPWVAKIGLTYVFVTILVIACVILLSFGVFIRFGKTFRARSAARYQRYAALQRRGRAMCD